MFRDSAHIVCERLYAMQELAGCKNFLLILGRIPYSAQASLPLPGLELPMEDPESLGLRPAECPHPRIGIPSSPSLDWNFSWRTWKVYVCPPWIPSSLHSCSIGSRVRESRLNIESKILINKKNSVNEINTTRPAPNDPTFKSCKTITDASKKTITLYVTEIIHHPITSCVTSVPFS